MDEELGSRTPGAEVAVDWREPPCVNNQPVAGQGSGQAKGGGPGKGVSW